MCAYSTGNKILLAYLLTPASGVNLAFTIVFFKIPVILFGLDLQILKGKIFEERLSQV